MSRTPETDGEWNRLACQDHPEFERNLADFARKLERERDEWKSKYIQQNKDLGCEMMDPNGTIWDYAKKVQKDLLAMTEQRDRLAATIERLKELPDTWRNECQGNWLRGGVVLQLADDFEAAVQAVQSLNQNEP